MRQDRARTLNREIGRLKHQPLFGCLDDEALRHLAFSAETRQFATGDVLFERGAPAEAAVLLVAGTLSLAGAETSGVSARLVSAGTLLNEMALFAPGVQTATATAQDAATILSVSHHLMLRVLDVYPDSAVALRRYWAARLRGRLDTFKDAIRR